ncbi:unnamed protein product [Allacma fusca]|uniref:Choline transporter-like protein n=1 Tax=Allacma fusca TaxID=39272 RepID=A0A8J2JIF2_9HEXA|nr:unnamed protein product [Allacma fusca]
MRKTRRYVDPQQSTYDRYRSDHSVGSIEDSVISESNEFNDSNNPLKKRRKCRDVFCLLLFVCFATTMVGVTLYAYLHGDYRRLIYGVDSNCDICGIQNVPKKGFQSSGQDQREFPFLIFQYADDVFYRARIDVPFGADFLNAEIFYVKQCLVTCPPDYKVVMNRCQPNITAEDAISDDGASQARMLRFISGERDILAEISEDLENTWQVIAWMCLVALGTAIIMTMLLRTLAGMIVWIVILGITLSAIGGTTFLWLYYVSITEKDDNLNVHPGDSIWGWERNKKFYTLVSAITSTVITLAILTISIGMRKRISLVIRLFREAGKAVHAMPLILLQPFWTFLALCGVCCASFSLGVLIETAGFEQKYISPEEPTERCKYLKDDILQVSRWLNIFAFFWFTQFIIGCQHFIIAGAISIWFFTRKKSTISWPILRSFDRLVIYHMGSIAMGSLLISIVKFIRLILNFVQKRLSNKNGFCRVLVTICQCCTWCLENCLIFLNRNAYVEIAIYGYGFCKSARHAFQTLVNNALRVAAINSIGDVVLFLAKMVTVIITVLIGYQMLKGRTEVHNIWVPLVIGAGLSYFISHCFISVYEMAIDTIFLCFCEDCARNDGVTKPYFMSRGLMEFVKQSQVNLREITSASSSR